MCMLCVLKMETERGSRGLEPAVPQRSQAQMSVSPDQAGLSGRPIQVVKVSAEHSFELDEPNLKSILDRSDVRGKPVVVVSVAGAFRKGKSFLLNFFIRYLTYLSKNGHDSGWLQDQNQPLAGFPWRGGADRETTGILMWSEPFVITNSEGVDVVVLLLDTQGAFDTESTVKECATIFALSTMVSSVQVYNIQANLQENDFQHLQLFTEYGKLAVVAGDESAKPFQSLLFLVRDWSYPYDNPYGLDGGNTLLEKRLQLLPTQHPELQLLRKQIRSCFETIDCFLMPHPGLKVATNPRFDGRLADIEPDFKEQLKMLVPQLLSKENLIIKEICSNQVTGHDLIEYFRSYMKIFQGDTLPEPKSLMQATAEANNLVALASAKALYSSRMDATAGGDRPYLHPDQLEEAHRNFRRQAVEAFHAVKKIGGEEFSQTYVEDLERYVAEMWDGYSKANAAKSMFHSMRSPITLFVCFVFFYTFSGISSAVGVGSLTSFFNAMMLVALVLLATWAYCRQSGELREIGSNIDALAQLIWDTALAGPAATLIEQGTNRITSFSFTDHSNRGQSSSSDATNLPAGLRHRTAATSTASK